MLSHEGCVLKSNGARTSSSQTLRGYKWKVCSERDHSELCNEALHPTLHTWGQVIWFTCVEHSLKLPGMMATNEHLVHIAYSAQLKWLCQDWKDWLESRVLLALEEDLGSVPTIHLATCNHLKFHPRDLPLVSVGSYTYVVHINSFKHTCLLMMMMMIFKYTLIFMQS